MRCLLVGGVRPAIEPIQAAIEAARFTCTHATNRREALARMATSRPDLVVIVPPLRDAPSITFLRDLRRDGVSVPVIVAGLELSRDQRIEHLEAGADEVFAAVPSRRELHARLRQLLVRSFGQASARIAIGPIEICLESAVANFNGQPARLSASVYAVLEALALKKGRLLSREQLIDFIYGGRNAPQERAIDVFVCALRRHMMEAGIRDPDALLRTIRGQGFMLTAPAAGVAVD